MTKPRDLPICVYLPNFYALECLHSGGFFVGKCAYFSILSHALNPKVRGIFFFRNEAVFYEPFG